MFRSNFFLKNKFQSTRNVNLLQYKSRLDLQFMFMFTHLEVNAQINTNKLRVKTKSNTYAYFTVFPQEMYLNLYKHVSSTYKLTIKK
jgi:hypothetical protein